MTPGGEGVIKIDRKSVYALWDKGLCSSDVAKIIGCDISSTRKILNGYEKFSKEENQNRLLDSHSRKQVYQYDKATGQLIMIHKSIKDASIYAKVDRSCISRVCSGKKRSSGGYIWKFNMASPEEVLKEYGE